MLFTKQVTKPSEVVVRLLSVCIDRPLLHLRGSYLRTLGYDVVDALDPASAVATLMSGDEFGMVILCHTLPGSDKLMIESVVERSHATVCTLELYLAELPVTGGMHAEATTEFQTLMRTMARLEFGSGCEVRADYLDDIGQTWLASQYVN